MRLVSKNSIIVDQRDGSVYDVITTHRYSFWSNLYDEILALEYSNYKLWYTLRNLTDMKEILWFPN